jgi:hypothetical protein
MTAVQIVHSSRRGPRDIEHIGSAHDRAGLAAVRVAAPQCLPAGQEELGQGPGSADRAAGRPAANHVLADRHLCCPAYRQTVMALPGAG